MKWLASIAITLWLLTGCATAPKPVPPTALVCPRLPDLVLDAPVRDWQGQMLNFLSGSLGTPPDYSLPSTNAGQGIKPPKNALQGGT